ncbi:MAG: hypothetical protein A4E60_02841 [Syntrophorhabdus sp. PtaB.Bin047]|jgi:hypothetical protein|nr:MAG: hypothetical protein A4E60_02841 [Syntrophorhabdus sp. PtaB.Bin047]
MTGRLGNQRGGAARWIFIIIIIAAAFFGYQYFKKTPRYALIQFKKAVLFSSAETAQKYADFDSVVRSLPGSVTLGQTDEVVKKRLIYEIDSPHEKSYFAKVKGWSVIRCPIAVTADQNSATAQTAENTSVTLQRLDNEQWIIVAIETQ